MVKIYNTSEEKNAARRERRRLKSPVYIRELDTNRKRWKLKKEVYNANVRKRKLTDPEGYQKKIESAREYKQVHKEEIIAYEKANRAHRQELENKRRRDRRLFKKHLPEALEDLNLLKLIEGGNIDKAINMLLQPVVIPKKIKFSKIGDKISVKGIRQRHAQRYKPDLRREEPPDIAVSEPEAEENLTDQKLEWIAKIDRGVLLVQIHDYCKRQVYKRFLNDIMFVLNRKFIYARIAYKMRLQRVRINYEEFKCQDIAQAA